MQLTMALAELPLYIETPAGERLHSQGCLILLFIARQWEALQLALTVSPVRNTPETFAARTPAR